MPYAKTMMPLEINQIFVSFGVSVFLIFFPIRIFGGARAREQNFDHFLCFVKGLNWLHKQNWRVISLSI